MTNVDRHRDLQYCTEVGTSSLINNIRFRQLEVVTDNAYEVEMSKSVVKCIHPLHIGFFVYQYAKLRMLQFYYDFIGRYVERCSSTARWTPIQHTSHLLAKPPMI